MTRFRSHFLLIYSVVLLAETAHSLSEDGRVRAGRPLQREGRVALHEILRLLHCANAGGPNILTLLYVCARFSLFFCPHTKKPMCRNSCVYVFFALRIGRALDRECNVSGTRFVPLSFVLNVQICPVHLTTRPTQMICERCSE